MEPCPPTPGPSFTLECKCYVGRAEKFLYLQPGMRQKVGCLGFLWDRCGKEKNDLAVETPRPLTRDNPNPSPGRPPAQGEGYVIGRHSRTQEKQN